MNNTYIAKALFGLVIACIFFCCGTGRKPVPPDVKKSIKLVSVVPIHHPNDNNTVLNFRGEITLIELDSLRIYKLLRKRSRSKITLDKNHDLVRDDLISIDTSYYFIIEKNGDNKGLMFDSTLNEQWVPVAIDSFLATATLFSVDKLISKKMQNDSLINSVLTENGETLTEIYIPKNKPDFTYSDTTILRYSNKLDDFLFSFSPAMDSLKGLKLSYVEMIYNPNQNGTDNFYKSRRSYTFEIIPEENQEVTFLESLVRKFTFMRDVK